MDCRTDEQLMALLQGGDRAALSELVARYHAPLLGYLFRLTVSDTALAEDLTQDTFTRVLQSTSFQSGRPLGPWLYAIATNLCRDAIRAPAARTRAAISLDSLPEPPAVEPTPEGQILAAKQASDIRPAINALGEEFRVTLILRFYQDLALVDIARTLDVPVGTVKSRLHTAVRRLRLSLAKQHEEIKP